MGGGSRVSLQEEFPDLKVAVITPFWNRKEVERENQEQYEAVLAASDFTESLTHRPYESPVQLQTKTGSSSKGGWLIDSVR
ncbi:SLOG family protein [Bacillus licheniformis]|nr:SLOG family protein [Bacillus licheniformis]